MLEEISIEIVRKCPNNCLHCSSSSDEHCTDKIDYDDFVNVIIDAADLGVRKICISGGEPFLHPDIIDMVNFIKGYDMECHIYTSGIIFNEHNNKVSLDENTLESVSKNVSSVIFNIEAAKSSTYDKIMGTKGCFKIMKQSIRNVKKHSITTEAHFVPMKINVDETEEVIKMCEGFGISKLSFLRLVSQGRALNNESEILLSNKDFINYIKKLNDLKKRSEINIRMGIPLAANTEYIKCHAAKGKLNIRYDGYVFPCEVFKNSNLSHDLNGTNPDCIYHRSLLDIYYNSAYLQQIREISEKNSPPTDCFEICFGQRLIADKNVLLPNE